MTETQTQMNKPRIEIRYCTLCRWMLRAAWLAQELLSTFDGELGEVALVPASKGEFRILVDGVQVWDRVADEGFPEAKEIKQRVRDLIAPERDLGHADRKPATE
ncbi:MULTISPECIES: SelT/SelW/SelH family protein [Aeromonas]|uniref:SelT/SelW/SelH family protein n=1 Tax=Aeromonas sanarellii TaxID=633415 RepID=A0ABS4B4Y4_9GAMM|nr:MULTISPECIES: SelT/SelW/SelH family protein [Aeromonas]MBP0602549.1 SelT/SelW/SelH family protein [Aeromonas sanarellii]MEB6606209.1 SelT/SelW/SelH family protein [Aeromonas sanarellii]QXC28947.1 SelT/SelW/SelH family protein [Aeromonas sp. FDAARGOS 1409]QXW31056.1 SelT/SelW/SelH family protein [Aeromonas sanarellii]WOX49671.1 SelT/SelW/SelH family protein [Aeromonas sp. XH]